MPRIAFLKPLMVQPTTGLTASASNTNMPGMFPALRTALTALLGLILPASLYAADERPLLIGVTIPLSGATTEYGEAVRNGIELALEDHSTLQTRLRFLYEDDGYDPKRALSAFRKLTEVNKVDLVFAWGNEPAITLAPLAERNRVALITVAHYPTISKNRRYVLRFQNTGAQYSRVMASYLHANGFKRLGLVKSELSFFNMLADGLVMTKPTDMTVQILDTFLPTDTDFRSSILRMKSTSMDCLGLYLLASQVRDFVRQSSQLDFTPCLFGATPFESRSVISDAWPLMEGALFAHNAVTDSFRQKYQSRYGSDVQLGYAANAYDFVTLTASLFPNGGAGLTSDGVIDGYRRSREQTGYSGQYRFVQSADEGDHFAFDLAVYRVTAGRAQEVFRSDYGRQQVR